MGGKTGEFVSYYRVSTKRQGRSGLGLEAQRRAVEDYLGSNGWEIVAEFTEVESGRKRARPELEKALAACRRTGATLVVAKLDRLARNAAFLLSLRDAGVDFVAADMPEANRLTVGVMACMAEETADAISKRTKEALAAAKERGVELGNPDNLTDAARAEGRRVAAEVRAARADLHAADLADKIAELREAGAESLRDLAEGLTADPTARTPRGRDEWHPVQVKRVLDRLEAAAAA